MIFMEQPILWLKIDLLKNTSKLLCCLKTPEKKTARRQEKEDKVARMEFYLENTFY